MENIKNNFSKNRIQTVGLLVDASSFAATEQLIACITALGILPENIKTIAYYDKIEDKESQMYVTIDPEDLKWNGVIAKPQVNDFIKTKFDLLISFYEIEKAILLQITHNSQAQFKVGFFTIDQRLNHFIIKTNSSNYSVFVEELFKYLKLLNKI